nr:retrovirus-related Pol polyprotein from transposon TNT 1-94 [Tanacetum cinerariifolium]
HREKMLLCKQEEAGIQLNAEQADWRDHSDDESDDQELEAHYMYMAKLQQVSPDVVDSGPIFDTEPEQKKSRIQCYNCKEYGHVARECQKPKRVKDAAYHREKMLLCKQEEAGIHEQIEQNDEDVDLAKE